MVVGRTLVKDAFNQEGEAQVLPAVSRAQHEKTNRKKSWFFWAKSFGFWENIPHSKLFRLLKHIPRVECCGGLLWGSL